MLDWLIALCPFVSAPCRAGPPLVIVAARLAMDLVTDRAMPAALPRGSGLRVDAGQPEDSDQRSHALVACRAGGKGPRGCEGWRAVPQFAAVAAASTGL